MVATQPNQRFLCRQWVVALFLSTVAAAQDGGATPQVVDRMAASINGRALTLNQLEFETRVLLILKGGIRAANEPLDEAALKVGLDEIIADTLAVIEADRIDAYALEAGELEAAIDTFRQSLGVEGYRAFLSRNDVEPVDISQVIKRRLRATKVWDGKLRIKAQISEAEARRFQADHVEVGTMSQEMLRGLMYKQRYEQLKQVELKQLRRQLDVRLMGPFATVSASP